MAGLAEEFSLTVPAEESDDGIVVSSTAQRVILGGGEWAACFMARDTTDHTALLLAQ